jgi:CBS domain-containing protein
MLVREVMTEPVVTVPVDATLEGAVYRMLEHRIGSVVVMADDGHLGIVTETDVLLAGHETGRPFAEIAVEDVMSRPLLTVPPDTTVRATVERMREAGVKKLGVADGIDLKGIVTHQDIVYAHPELIQEAIHLEERRQDWERDLTEE